VGGRRVCAKMWCLNGAAALALLAAGVSCMLVPVEHLTDSDQAAPARDK